MFSLSTELYVPQNVAEEIPRLGAQNGQPFTVAVADSIKEKSQEEDTVRVSISREASDMLEKVEGETLPAAASEEDDGAQNHSEYDLKDENSSYSLLKEKSATQTASSQKTAETDVDGLTAAEEDQVRRLQARDQEVRTHERQHMAVAGELAVGGPQYTYQRGPDGKMYAIGGHVNIDTGSESDPAQSRLKAAKIRSAAMASGDASAADASVAAQANMMESASVGQMASVDERSLVALAMKIQAVYGANSPAVTGQHLATQA